MNKIMTSEAILQLGAMGIILLFTIKELFAYLKSRKNGNGSGADSAILRELQTMNSNHLHSIKRAIEDGNSRLVDAIHADNNKMIELLGRIDGKLDRR